jgi:hypothetical protein
MGKIIFHLPIYNYWNYVLFALKSYNRKFSFTPLFLKISISIFFDRMLSHLEGLDVELQLELARDV